MHEPGPIRAELPLLRRVWLMLVAAMSLLAATARAEEPLFGYTYTTDLLPQDKFEFAQWATWRAKKATGEFDVLEGRTEFEYGVSDRLQVSAFVNYEWARAYHDNVITGATLPPATLANVNVGPDERLDTTRFTGVSVEGIYRFLSPYTGPLGVAVYFRPSVGPQFRELETRLILQKNYRDDQLVLAFNLGLSNDWRYLPTTPGKADSPGYLHPWDTQSTVTLGLGASYRVVRNWSVGLEVQNERGFAGENPFAAHAKTNAAYYVGPTIHYANEHLYATLTYLDQLPFASDYVHAEPDFVVGARSYAPSFERYRLRAKFGWYF